MTYCIAIEEVMKIEPPPRAQYLRVVWPELSRIHSHPLWLVLARSVPRQTKPYRELPEALKDQVIFVLKETPRTIVGFRIPQYLGEINVAGYHPHFLSKDRKSGGHVLDCKIISGELELDGACQLDIIFSRNRDFLKLDLSESKVNDVKK